MQQIVQGDSGKLQRILTVHPPPLSFSENVFTFTGDEIVTWDQMYRAVAGVECCLISKYLE